MYDVIVIGAGPSGMMASITAAKNNKSVLLIDKNEKIGMKLELTGGTRCNLTNLKSVSNFIKQIPVNNKTLYSALTKFGPQDIYDYFTKLGVDLKVEDDDRVFPVSNKSKTIIDALYNELINSGVTLRLDTAVIKITITDGIKRVVTNTGTYRTRSVIVATGGCSYPETGSTGDGYEFAKMIKQPVTKLYPADTFLVTKETIPLSGITIDDTKIYFNEKEVEGSLLFTHTGLSGPGIFKISEEVYKALLKNKIVTISIDLIPKLDREILIKKLDKYNPKKEINSFFKEYLPKNLVDYIIPSVISNLKIGSISKTQKTEIISKFKEYKVDIKKTGSLERSLVTGGGINIKYINPKTMESTIHKGVYFCGEVLDLHGHTGGYNITIALSTGYAAGFEIK